MVYKLNKLLSGASEALLKHMGGQINEVFHKSFSEIMQPLARNMSVAWEAAKETISN